MAEPVVRVRPRSSLIRTALVSMLVAMVPASIAVYGVAIPAGRWTLVLVVQAVVVALCGVAGARQLRLVTEVDARELRGNGIATPMVRVPLDDIERVHLVSTLIHGGSEETTQLLVTDAEGRRLFRLRGNYWPPDALDRVADALPVPVTRHRDPVPIAVFWREHPGSAYWFEDRKLVRVLAAGGVLLVASGIAVGVMFGLAS